jgi:hypothetical protein
MNHARDNVFTRPTLALDEYRNVCARQFREPVAYGLHGLGAPENNGVGRHFPQRLGK